MTKYVDLEKISSTEASSTDFDLIIVGGGAAGLTLVRELAMDGLKIAVLESGSFDETPFHEELNRVDVEPSLMAADFVEQRRLYHARQLKVWDPSIQRFGVRCRVLGGSTAAWAGKVAPFDAIDYEERPWIGSAAWPIGHQEMSGYVDRAAQHLDLGPLAQGDDFWSAASRNRPVEFAGLQNFSPFFWQFARSRNALTDVMRFGPDFQREQHQNVTVILNATAADIKISDDKVTGIEAVSSLTARQRIILRAPKVVLACGAIENARLLLLSRGNCLALRQNDAIGRYLMDHPSIRLGEFKGQEKERSARLLGFYPILQNYRVYMYSCGLALRAETQRSHEMPNMAVFLGVTIADDDPLQALARIAKFRSSRPLTDCLAVLKNTGFVLTSLGQKLLNYRRIPMRLRRLAVDAAVFINANMVARDYTGNGRGRKLDRVTLNIISEQPSSAENRIVLSEKTDHLDLNLAKVDWNIPSSLKRNMIEFSRLLKEDFERAGIKGFEFDQAFISEDNSALTFCDMAHTAGTTRMGVNPDSSVVDPSLQVHGVNGLFVLGASVFPSSGHANPTLVILALAILLADEIKRQASKPNPFAVTSNVKPSGPLVVVTEASGGLRNYLVERLTARGYRVRCQYRDEKPSDANCEWVECDFSQRELPDTSIDALLDGASAVMYLTAHHASVGELQAANVINLQRLAAASERLGVRYFGLESSMVVYGSPTTRVVPEHAQKIDLGRPMEKQYFAEPFMREYARSKVMGEDIIASFGEKLHVDIYRVAVEQDKAGLRDCLNWSRKRALFSLYRNSHFISSENVANAMIHLMEKALSAGSSGTDVYNIADTNSPTFADVYRENGRKVGLNVPIVLDVIKGIKISKSFAFRYPMGCFRLDDAKLRASGFVFDQNQPRASVDGVRKAKPGSDLIDAYDSTSNDPLDARKIVKDMA